MAGEAASPTYRDRVIALLDMEAGPHEIVVAVRRPSDGSTAIWGNGVGDGKTANWHPQAFLMDL